MKHWKAKVVFAAILLCAFFLRVYGVNWDQNQHLHPDERFLTMVTSNAKLPPALASYLDPATSTLNPYNIGHTFYVYGTFPVTLTKVIAIAFERDNYNDVTIIGRLLSAIFDTATVVYIFLMVQLWERRFKLKSELKFIAAFLYAIAVLPIQQSHFFSADAIATHFSFVAVFLAMMFAEKPLAKYTIASAFCMGIAVACKISSIYVIPLIAVLFMLGAVSQERSWRTAVRMVGHALLYGFISYVILRIGDPRFFSTNNFLNPSINPLFLANIQELGRLTQADSSFPPQIQWLRKQALLFPFQNMMLYGVGIPYMLLSIVGMIMAAKARYKEVVLVLVWMAGLFVYQGTRTTMSLRYFYILYPFLAIFAAWVLVWMNRNVRIVAILVCLIWPIAFMSIYTKPHSRVAASEWIYRNIPAGSKILTEHWDDGLPLSIAPTKTEPAKIAYIYTYDSLHVFDFDTPEKITQLKAQLKEADYYILSSNRGYGSITTVPEKYPYTDVFYTELFAGKLGYTQVAEFTSFPTLNLGIVQIPFDDQNSEEAFTVYDHPRVLIFKNTHESKN